MKNPPVSVNDVDACLPQTQCGLCDYGACRPYAEAIVNQGEAINRCPPGGTRVLQQLAELTGQDPTPYWEDLQAKHKPVQVVSIREDACIGCTKCIQACPVDAIVGAGKLMHTVISAECTGCELCIEPCPVDCIDLHALNEPTDTLRLAKANVARERYEARQQRLARNELKARQEHQRAKSASPTGPEKKTPDEKKAFILAALERSKQKKQKSTAPAPKKGSLDNGD